MFADSFGANLLFFLLCQVVAWAYLRTGLVPRGIVVLIVSWVFADLALVLRFAYGETGGVYIASLGVMQAIACAESIRLVWAGLRRRRPAFRVRREAAYRDAMVQFMRDDLEAAGANLRGLVRADPWDLQARLTFGVVLARQGIHRAARRQLVGARRLDRARRYADAIEIELKRVKSA